MSCHLSEQELWSGLDRDAEEVTTHVKTCPTCQKRAAAMRSGIGALADLTTPAIPSIPDRIGSYRIRRRLGAGGMGLVYEGEQKIPKRLVAVKVLRGGRYVDEYRLKLFQREVETLARLKHPSIAAVYEAGRTEEGQHFFTMELVRGMRLNEYVREKKVPRRERLRLFCKICEAVNYAHLRGVIHRDLKPTNILVDTDDQPKILDFGLARFVDPEKGNAKTATEVGKVMGTLPYMSPEDAKGNFDKIDVRSDVYSLGVILYDLLTDRLPYQVSRKALHEAVRIICEESPRRPGSIDRSLRGDLETIALKALEKSRGRRYQSAALMAEDIQRYLTDQPILARPRSVIYPLRKFIKRHAITVSVTLASLLVVAASSLRIRWSEEEQREAFQRLQRTQDLDIASRAKDMASAYAELGRMDKALAELGEALRIFQNLERDDQTVKTHLALAQLLFRQGQPERYSRDELEENEAKEATISFEKAEKHLLDALAIIDGREGLRSMEDHRAVLELLHRIYGPKIFDSPDGAAGTKAELEDLADLERTLHLSPTVPKTSNPPPGPLP